MADPELKVLVYKACLAAVWSDDSMSSVERRHLAGVVEVLADTEEERRLLRRQTLSEVTREIVLQEVSRLDPDLKNIVFEECLSVLVADKELQKPDQRFLNELRAVCGVGWFAYQGRLWRMWRRGRLKGHLMRKTAFASALMLTVWFALKGPAKVKVQPHSYPSGHAIVLSGVDTTPQTIKKDLEPEWVFRIVRDSFATVEVFIDGDLKVTGSAALIGYDQQKAAYYITNRHVVDHEADEKVRYRLRFFKNALSGAQLDYSSSKSDLAVLRVDIPDRFRPPLMLRPKAFLRVGQPVYALGSPNGLLNSFSAGIVSAIRPDMLQSDAVTDSGSSGGPLVDAAGRLVGINTKAHTSKPIGFAIYADSLLEVLSERLPKDLRPPPGTVGSTL